MEHSRFTAQIVHRAFVGRLYLRICAEMATRINVDARRMRIAPINRLIVGRKNREDPLLALFYFGVEGLSIFFNGG